MHIPCEFQLSCLPEDSAVIWGGVFPRSKRGRTGGTAGLAARRLVSMTLTARRAAAAPEPVRLSILLWLTAIAAGALEALVYLLGAEPPTPPQLVARFTIYAVLTALVLCLRTGHNAARWAVAVLLGGIGTVSLVIEPVTWLLAGGSPAAFLAAADAPTLLGAGLRVVHVVAVLTALVLMFRPAANAWFRRR
jgi:hypothetical protein